MTTDILAVNAFREHFPILKQRVYVNSCSQGALSLEVEAAFRALLESWHDRGSPWDTWVEVVEELRREFAGAIGAGADEIAVLPSASAGIASLATALAFDGKRRAVAMGDLEFPTMSHVWLAQRRRGAEIRWVQSKAGALTTADYARVVDDDTLIVPVTHVCFRNGFRSDVAGIAATCRDRGAYVLVDDYQSTGTRRIDVHALGIDFLVTGCLKYLLGPAGAAFLYVRREIIERFQPLVTGWFGRVNPFAFDINNLDWADRASRFEAGTPAVPIAYGALAGLRLLKRVGFDVIERHIELLAKRFVNAAIAEGYVVRTPTTTAGWGPLVVLRSHDATTLATRLGERGIIGSSRDGGLRISFHAYNNEDDVQAVLGALRAEASLLVRADGK